MGIRFVVMEMVAMRIEKALINTTKILVIELEKAMILRPPRGDQVDLHAICSECVRVQQGFDCRLWFLVKKIPTMHKINKIKIELLHKLLPLSINYKTHSCDSFEFNCELHDFGS